MSDRKLGVLAIIAACTVWGLSPLYYKSIGHISPMEVLSHRTIWSFVLFFTLIVFQFRVSGLVALFSNARSVALIAFSTLMVSTNWFLFIWAIQSERTIEMSLGYFIQPLVAVALGFIFLRERLAHAQWTAVAIASFAVVVLAIGAGFIPWLPLILAISFALYGLTKKRMSESALLTVTAEVLLFTPVSAVWLWGAHQYGWTGGTDQISGVFGTNVRDSVLLIFSGAMTAGPLILLSYGARRVSLATTGITQYLNPTLQFLLAVIVFSEPFTWAHGIGFTMIWSALLLYSVSALRQQRARPDGFTRG